MNQDFIVSTLVDENDGDFSAGDLSLREAIARANDNEGEDTISFDSSLSGGTIAIDESLERDLNINDSVTIDGLGQDSLTLNGGFIFDVAESDIDLEIDGLNLVGGKIDSFGDLSLTDSAISQTIARSGSSDNSSIISRGTLFISDSTIKDNSGGDNIGILIESGIANIERSTIANNEGVLGGSGILILTDDTVNIRNSTIVNNQNRFVGGIANAGGSDRVNILSSTITDNNGGLGSGGIQNSSGTVTVTSTVLANNTGGGFIGDIFGDGEFISGGNNLISNGDDATGFVDGVNGDLVGSNGDDPGNPQTELLIDPQLGELQDNGGSTETLALLDGSPALDAGSDPTNLSTDQRGGGFPRRVGSSPDIGAFEVQENDGGEVPIDLVVSTLVDENDGDFSAGDLSLREAIAQAKLGNTITFDQSLSGGTITLTQGELAIDKSLTINGLGAENIIIDGGGSDNFFDGIRVFNINDNSDAESQVVINDLTITGGGAFVGRTDKPSGAGIYNTENLEINNAIIRDNTADLRGGGIFSEGTLTVKNSAIYNNSAQRRGAPGGGIANAGTATIVQSTIANNNVDARSPGGGIYNEGNLTVSNSTVSGNSDGIDNNGEATLVSTIVAGNSNNSDLQGDDIISGGNNLIGGEATSSLDIGQVGGLANIEDSDIVGTADNSIDPQLGELQNNGGATPTQALQKGSPAIDAGSNPNNLETDQRGEGFNRTVGNGTDIGAYEVQDGNGGQTPTDLVVSTLVDENDGDFSAGDLSLREAIALSNKQEGKDTIIFDSGLSGGTIALAESQERDLNISDSVSIDGLGQDNLTLDGGFIFDIANADTNVAIDGLNLTGGKIDSSGNLTLADSTISHTISRPGSSDNSAIISRGTTTISDSTISDNNGGGNVGILVESGTTNIERSTIANNQAVQAQSGIIVRSDATVNVSNSTIANNQGRSNAGIENAGTAEISNTTIANNTGGLGAGGLINFNDANATVTSSIIGNSNLKSTPIGDVSGNGKFTSGGNNLISNGDDATGFVDSDIVGTLDNPINPQLGELQNNGGATETFALLNGSSAIDAGSNPNNLETDQRGEGFNRTVGNGTDIGAYEVQEVVDNSATEGNDTLIGTDGNDLISGLGGDDLILGKDGHDSLNGNDGKDIIFGDGGDDLICGGNGSDLLFGGEGNDTIDGGAGKDIIFGGGGNNTIVDSSGKDIIIDNLKDGMLINGQQIGSFLENYGQDLFSSNNFDVQSSIAEVAYNSDLLVF